MAEKRERRDVIKLKSRFENCKSKSNFEEMVQSQRKGTVDAISIKIRLNNPPNFTKS